MNRSALRVAYGTTLLFVMGVASLAPAMPRIRETFDVGQGQITLFIAVFALPGVVLAPLFGTVIDRVGAREILVPTLLVYGIAGCLVPVAGDFRLALLFRLVQGAGNAPLGTIALTLVGRGASPRERANALGMNAAVLSLGAAFWPLAGGGLASLDWRLPFCLAALSFPLALAARLVLPRGETGGRETLAVYLSRLREGLTDSRMLGLYLAAFGCFMLLYGSFLTQFPLYLASRFSAGPFGIGVVVACMSLPTAVTAAKTRALAERWGSRNLLLAAFALYAGAFVLLPLMPGFLWTLAPCALFGVAQALAIPNIQLLIAARAPEERRAFYMSVYSMCMHLAQTFAPLALGVAVGALGHDATFAAGAVAGILFGLASGRLIVEDRKHRAPGEEGKRWKRNR